MSISTVYFSTEMDAEELASAVPADMPPPFSFAGNKAKKQTAAATSAAASTFLAKEEKSFS